MMDYMSEFPSPPKDVIVFNTVQQLFADFEKFGITKEDMYVIAETEYEKFEKFGSQAAWLTITGPSFIKNVKYKIITKYNLNT